MYFENLIKTVEVVATDLSRISAPPKLALCFCCLFTFVCFFTILKSIIPPKRARVYNRWRRSEWFDIYDAFDNVPHCVWCDFKRIKLKEKQLGGRDGRIISAHGLYFEYAFKISGARLLVCSNLKKDKVYRL